MFKDEFKFSDAVELMMVMRACAHILQQASVFPVDDVREKMKLIDLFINNSIEGKQIENHMQFMKESCLLLCTHLESFQDEIRKLIEKYEEIEGMEDNFEKLLRQINLSDIPTQ